MRIGGDTLTIRRGDRVIKIPKRTRAIIYSSTFHPLAVESEIYKRLGNHEGIAEIFQQSDDAIEMPYYKNGSLDDFLITNQELPYQYPTDWIRRLVDTLDYIHENRVLYFDLFLRNILVTDTLSLKLIDFGDSSAIPLETSFSEFSSMRYKGASVQMDIFYLGWIIYSIEKWEPHSYDLFAKPRTNEEDCKGEPSWPELHGLPETEDMRYGRVIRKCWLREYQGMRGVQIDLGCTKDRISFENDPTSQG
jgi:serine/threonine protein kinase